MENSTRSDNPGSLLCLRSAIQKALPLQFLKDITNNFTIDQEVGRGSFGVVYMGKLQNGEELAVKKFLLTTPFHEKFYENEVRSLMEIKHDNVVELIGYCCETHRRYVRSNGELTREDIIEKLLCYEYFRKGSLDKLLFDETSILDWRMRFKIIEGICSGLHFLHKELETPIIHMDLKPENILLDDNMVPKIADFGLSRLFSTEKTRTNTLNVIGSIGYMAPEYILDGIVSTQSDIYSLGILIIEITTGEKNKPTGEYMSGELYIKNVQENWNNLSHTASKYPSLDRNSLNQVKTCIQVGLDCVKHVRKERPSITEIVHRLNM